MVTFLVYTCGVHAVLWCLRQRGLGGSVCPTLVMLYACIHRVPQLHLVLQPGGAGLGAPHGALGHHLQDGCQPHPPGQHQSNILKARILLHNLHTCVHITACTMLVDFGAEGTDSNNV